MIGSILIQCPEHSKPYIYLQYNNQSLYDSSDQCWYYMILIHSWNASFPLPFKKQVLMLCFILFECSQIPVKYDARRCYIGKTILHNIQNANILRNMWGFFLFFALFGMICHLFSVRKVYIIRFFFHFQERNKSFLTWSNSMNLYNKTSKR